MTRLHEPGYELRKMIAGRQHGKWHQMARLYSVGGGVDCGSAVPGHSVYVSSSSSARATGQVPGPLTKCPVRSMGGLLIKGLGANELPGLLGYNRILRVQYNPAVLL